jgi:hypothetical protein
VQRAGEREPPAGHERGVVYVVHGVERGREVLGRWVELPAEHADRLERARHAQPKHSFLRRDRA